MQAFFDLDSERPVGFGLGRIPFSAIVAYGQLYEFDEQQREELIYFTREMDAAHLKRAAEKTESK